MHLVWKMKELHAGHCSVPETQVGYRLRLLCLTHRPLPLLLRMSLEW